jgi:hypothetical protein
MKTKTVEPYNLYLYCEVWEVLEWRGNQVFKTKSLKAYVPADYKNPDPKRYLFSSVSTDLLKSKESVTLPIWENKA